MRSKASKSKLADILTPSLGMFKLSRHYADPRVIKTLRPFLVMQRLRDDSKHRHFSTFEMLVEFEITCHSICIKCIEPSKIFLNTFYEDLQIYYCILSMNNRSHCFRS